MNTWPASNPILPPVDWKKEAEIMRRGGLKLVNNKKAALRSLIAAGIDLKTGRVKAK